MIFCSSSLLIIDIRLFAAILFVRMFVRMRWLICSLDVIFVPSNVACKYWLVTFKYRSKCNLAMSSDCCWLKYDVRVAVASAIDDVFELSGECLGGVGEVGVTVVGEGDLVRPYSNSIRFRLTDASNDEFEVCAFDGLLRKFELTADVSLLEPVDSVLTSSGTLIGTL